jgi:hypothetical protein
MKHMMLIYIKSSGSIWSKSHHLKCSLGCKFLDFNFPIVKFQFRSSNIPKPLAYEPYISKLIRYFRTYVSSQDLLYKRLLLTSMLLNQSFLLIKHQSSFRKLCIRWVAWVWQVYMLHNICSVCRSSNVVLLCTFKNCHNIWLLAGFCCISITMGVTNRAGTAYPR